MNNNAIIALMALLAINTVVICYLWKRINDLQGAIKHMLDAQHIVYKQLDINTASIKRQNQRLDRYANDIQEMRVDVLSTLREITPEEDLV